MGNVQSEPSAGGGSRKEQASDRSSDSRRTSPVEPEVTPSSPAMRLARGLGVWFPGSSAPPGILVPPEPQVSPSPLPLTLELPSPVTPLSEGAAAAAVSTPPPPPVGTLLPAPSKWRKPTGTPTPVPRIRGLLEARHRGQGDPPSLRPLPPPPPRQRTGEDPDSLPRAPSPTPPFLAPRKPPPPPPPSSDRQPPGHRITPARATPATTPTENQVGYGSEGQTARAARRGAPPQAGEGEMARPAVSESGLSLLCKVTFKSGPPLAPAAASSSSAAKASLGGGGGGGLFSAASGSISYAEVLKQGSLAPGPSRPSGEVPRESQEAEGGDGDGEGCSGPPSAPVSHARALPPPPYTTFPSSKPKFDWASPPDGPERHFRFNGAGGSVGAPRRRAATLSGPWGSPPPPPGQTHPGPGSRRPAPALLAPPMFIFPAPTNGEPVSPGPTGPQELLPPPPPTPPPTPPPAPPPTPQPPVLQPTPPPVARPPSPVPGHLESTLAPAPAPILPLALAADQAPALAPAPSPAPAPTTAEPTLPAPAPIKARTRRNKGPRAARGATRAAGAPGDGPRERTAATVTDSGGGGGGGGGAPPAGMANTGTTRHWPPFQVLNSCPCKCYCRHQLRHRRLPRNVSAWLSTPTNHLSEPPWVATIKLAGSLVAGLEHYDLQATHSN
ncbi:gametogenetin [Lynx canadensis]|uniref:gametogenetin n=1 Tax=Lynx canadensis TaxID=61383 RepID=UPI0011B05582|nr:gametogenetin [Lynx canadensis]